MSLHITRFLFFVMLGLFTTGSLVSMIFFRKHKLSNIMSNVLSTAAAAIGIWLSGGYLLSGAGRFTLINLSTPIPYINFDIMLDKLSAFFILTLSILVLCVSLYSIGYISKYYRKRSVGLFNFLYNIFIMSMIGVIVSGNIILFLIWWEIMSLISFFLVIFEGEQQENRKAGIIYLVMTHIATSFLIIAFALIYKYTGSFDIGGSLQAASPFIKNLVFLFLLLGFGTKAGIIPLHIWLPYAHPAAPSNVSSLMSGIMIKTAVYGLIRFVLGMLGAEYQWWGVAILILGSVSAILGVAYALMSNNIKKVLAYSSIENMGIIFIGLGIAFTAYSNNNLTLCSLAIIAALLHLFNHSVFKGLLFLGAGSIHYSTHTKDLEKLGGLIKVMPYTGLFFLVASLSISSIPPFNGFAGEWLTYQALFMSLGIDSVGLKLITMLSVAALAMGGALAAACFVKSFGISFLGRPRSSVSEEAKEVPATMLSGMGILSVMCLAFGLFPTLIIRLLDNINSALPKYIASSSSHSVLDNMKGTASFIYYPITIGKNTFSPLLLLITVLLLAIMVFAVVKIIGRRTKERIYRTWDCGFTELDSRMQYSATGFSKPLRIVLRGLYMPARELQIEEGSSPYYHKSMKYKVSTQPIFEKYLYGPIINLFTRFARKIKLTIQTGSVHAYLIYIFLTIVALLIYYGVQ